MVGFSQLKVETCEKAPRWSAPVSFASYRVFKQYYNTLVLMAVLLAIGGHGVEANPQQCIGGGAFVGAFDPNNDYFPDKSEPGESAHWSVDYHGYYKVVKNLYLNTTYVLTQCGASAPDATQFPENTKYFSIPLNNVAVEETVPATYLEALGLRTKVKYIDTTYLTSPCLLEMESRQLLEKFEHGWNHDAKVRAGQIAQVEAVIGAGVDIPDEPKFIPFSATQDPGSLQVAEWIKFLAVFFNKEKVANTVFSESEARYSCHSKAAKARANSVGHPVVAWLDNWSWEALPFRVTNTAYKRHFTEDAGGVMHNDELHTFATAAELFAHLEAAGVEVVIDETYDLKDEAAWMATYGVSSMDDVNFEVWRNDRLGKYQPALYISASDWFESMYPEPDVVLEDIISILHPGLQPHLPHWFRQPSEPRMNVTSKCVNINEQLKLKHDGCPFEFQDSCESNCGYQAAGGCWCDEQCVKWNDCCFDRDDICVFEEATCMNACGGLGQGTSGEGVTQCYCDQVCSFHGDCCDDYEEICDPQSLSCAGNCGGSVVVDGVAQCYCDELCVGYGDCCDDYQGECAE